MEKKFSKKALTDNIWLKLTEKVYSNKLTVRVKQYSEDNKTQSMLGFVVILWALTL